MIQYGNIVQAFELLFPKSMNRYRIRKARILRNHDNLSFLFEVISKRRRRGLALDIGANSGVYTSFLADHFDAVIALEPQIERAHYLTRVCAGNVSVICAGASNRVGIEKIYIPATAGFAKQHQLASIDRSNLQDFSDWGAVGVDHAWITVFPVDDIINKINPKSVDFVKIDVEGHELQVINGIEKTIRNFFPIVLCEIQNKDMAINNKLAKIFFELGYRCELITQIGGTPIYTIDDLMISVRDRRNYNYLFLKDV